MIVDSYIFLNRTFGFTYSSPNNNNFLYFCLYECSLRLRLCKHDQTFWHISQIAFSTIKSINRCLFAISSNQLFDKNEIAFVLYALPVSFLQSWYVYDLPNIYQKFIQPNSRCIYRGHVKFSNLKSVSINKPSLCHPHKKPPSRFYLFLSLSEKTSLRSRPWGGCSPVTLWTNKLIVTQLYDVWVLSLFMRFE